MKPSFSDILRLLAMLVGTTLLGFGITMIRSGLKAEGSIDISALALSGTLKTGSAGLFVCFFGFLLVASPLLLGAARAGLEGEIPGRSDTKRKVVIFSGLTTALIFCAVLATKAADIMLAFLLVGICVGILVVLALWLLN